MEKFLLVGLGGAVGAVGRYGISLIPVKTQFPVLTLLTNLLGAVLIGVIVGLAEGAQPIPGRAVLFWKTGVCGGFTTFSTFSLEAVKLLEQGRHLAGALYIALSIFLCLGGVCAGRWAAVHFGGKAA